MTVERFTRCPHCATVFRVESAQLRQAQFWLRCGQCELPFDATGRVVLCQSDNASATDGAQRLDLDALLHTEDKGSGPSVAETCDSAASPIGAAGAVHEELLAFEQALATFPVPQLESTSLALVPAKLSEDEPVTRAQSRRWSWAWIMLLTTLLLAQGLWATRAQWSVRWPWWGQSAQALCERWACSLPPWREPQVLALAHARLVQNEDGQSLLQWTLHNQASWPVQTPYLELTLLDVHEQVWVRRIFSPKDWRGPAVLSGGERSLGELSWPALEDGAVAAYRLLVFYP